jgi:hypothetical protein
MALFDTDIAILECGPSAGMAPSRSENVRESGVDLKSTGKLPLSDPY